MAGLLAALFEQSPFHAHGICLKWDTELIALHVGSDVLIGLAYYSIPFVLIVFGMQRTDLQYRWILHLFAAFILLCGTTHVVGAVTMWEPVYYFEGVVKALTAVVSLATAALLWPLLPRVLALPGPGQLRTANAALEAEIVERRAAESRVQALNADLEERVRRRTAELEDVVARLESEIAEREAAQREAAEARETAEASNRAKSDFLAHMSHELRTPLNVVLGYAEVIADQSFGPDAVERYRDYAQSIRKSGTHLLSIINDMLDLSKVEAGAFELDEEPLSVPDLVGEVADLMTPRVTVEGVSLETHCAADLPALVADRRVVTQALLNLLSNAAKFTPGDGRIALSADRRADGGLDITVRDSGSGMTEAQIARAMEPFGQVRGSKTLTQEGTGLGLPLCQRFMMLHDGELLVDSTPGEGTAVTLHFPAERSRDG